MTKLKHDSRPTIAIDGDTLAGWTAAAVLCRELADTARVVVRADASHATRQPQTAVLDGESVWLVRCGLAADRLLQQGDGGFALATRFAGFASGNSDAWLASGEPLPAIDGVALHQIVLRAAFERGQPRLLRELYAPLAFQARTAALGRMAAPAEDRSSPRSLLRPAIRVDAHKLTDLLKDIAMNAGAQTGVSETSAWLHLDCRAGSPSHRYASAFAYVTTAFATPTETGPLPHDPFDTVQIVGGGLLHTAPLRNGTALTFWHSDAEDDAHDRLSPLMLGHSVKITGTSTLQTEVDDPLWEGGTIRLACDTAYPGPIAGSDSAVLSAQVEQLLTHLPPFSATNFQHHARAYNRTIGAIRSHHDDLITLTLARGAWPNLDKTSWDVMPSANLARRLREFERRGRHLKIDQDPFEKSVWLDLMISLGLTPSTYDRVADGIDLPQQMKRLGQIIGAFDETIAAMSSHAAFLARALEAET